MKLLSKKHFLLGVVSLFISSAIFAQAGIPLSKCDITVINKTTNASVKTSEGPASAVEPGQQDTFSSQDSILCNPAQTATTTANGITIESSKTNSAITYTLSGKYQPTMPSISCSNQCKIAGKNGDPTWDGKWLLCVACQ